MRFVAVADSPYRDSYLQALAEGFRMGKERPMTGEALAAAKADPESFFAGVAHPAPIVTLPNGEQVARPPTTILWWVDDDVFVGALHIHHVLSSAMVAAYAGHIVYGVRPSRQRQGHAKRMLAAALPIAGSLGIERALICVRVGNMASRRVIEAVGGIFMDEVPIPYDREPDRLRRYIVPTGGSLAR